jgi:ribosomal protein L16 Arg81 hydroxylase
MVEVSSTMPGGAELRLPFGFADLIEPLGVEAFIADYWEQRHVVLHRESPEHYTGLLTLPDMDELLATSRVRSSDLRIMADGKETAVSDLVGDDPGSYANAVEALYAQYRKGATINLLFLEQQWAPLARLCHALSDVLNAMFHVNTYLTPAGTRGLSEHYDTHDVFVAQVYGTKHWRLYRTPVQLPLTTQHYSRPEHGLGEPIADFHLAPGDLLYMPRGTVHEAVSNDTASLHLTIGVQPMRWSDVLRRAVDRAMERDVRFRRALPLGFARDAASMRAAGQQAAELVELLRASVNPEQMVEAARAKAMLAHRSALAGHLLDLEGLGEVGLDTKVRRRSETVSRLLDGPDGVRLEFHGKELRFPAHVLPDLRHLTGTAVLTARELPGGLDEPGRLVLVRTLLREGFLTLADRPE